VKALLEDRTARRLAVCALLAALGIHFGYFQATHRPLHSDIAQVWFAARAVLHGQNPYALIGPGRAFEWAAPLFYPLPAALVGLPLAPFPEHVATALFAGVGVGVFAWALTEYGYGPLWALLSVCTYQCVEIAQWAPLLAGAYAIAPLSVILIAKPTVGAAVFAARPSRWAIVGGAVLIVLAFVLQPGWVGAWREALRAASVGAGSPFPYKAPIAFPGGVLALFALTRWRRPEARLLAVLACVPQTTLPYEGLLLFLIPRGWRQAVTLTALSWAMVIFTREVINPHGLTGTITAYGPMMTAFLYLPCTIMVMRRPNEGALPSWIVEWTTRVHQRWIFRRRVEVLASHIAELIPASARTVLDVGCGDGTLAALVMQRRPELTIQGLELKARPTTAIPVREFDGTRLPEPNRSVDVVLFVDVLHHADNVTVLLADARRVARQAVIVKDHLSDPWLAYLRLWWMDWAGNAGHGVSLRTLYRKAGMWTQDFHGARLIEQERRTRLGLYPLPLRPIFEHGLHFVSRLSPTDPSPSAKTTGSVSSG
jgi:SAM-dependent methyltransferase